MMANGAPTGSAGWPPAGRAGHGDRLASPRPMAADVRRRSALSPRPVQGQALLFPDEHPLRGLFRGLVEKYMKRCWPTGCSPVSSVPMPPGDITSRGRNCTIATGLVQAVCSLVQAGGRGGLGADHLWPTPTTNTSTSSALATATTLFSTTAASRWLRSPWMRRALSGRELLSGRTVDGEAARPGSRSTGKEWPLSRCGSIIWSAGIQFIPALVCRGAAFCLSRRPHFIAGIPLRRWDYA